MGMFDDYRPKGPLNCRACNAVLVDGNNAMLTEYFQGKSGPCQLFTWRQGERHSVGQYDDAPQPATEENTLPDRFYFYTTCPACQTWNGFVGECEDGVWTETSPAEEGRRGWTGKVKR